MAEESFSLPEDVYNVDTFVHIVKGLTMKLKTFNEGILLLCYCSNESNVLMRFTALHYVYKQYATTLSLHNV